MIAEELRLYVSARDADVEKANHVGAQTSSMSSGERAAFKATIATTLVKLGKEVRGNLKAVTNRVEGALTEMYEVIEIERLLQHMQTGDSTMSVPVERVLSCLVHMKKSCATRSLMCLVWDSGNLAMRPDLDTAAKRKAHLEHIEVLITKHLTVLGNREFQFKSFLFTAYHGLSHPPPVSTKIAL